MTLATDTDQRFCADIREHGPPPPQTCHSDGMHRRVGGSVCPGCAVGREQIRLLCALQLVTTEANTARLLIIRAPGWCRPRRWLPPVPPLLDPAHRPAEVRWAARRAAVMVLARPSSRPLPRLLADWGSLREPASVSGGCRRPTSGRCRMGRPRCNPCHRGCDGRRHSLSSGC